MDNEQMAELYSRRRDHMLAYRASLESALAQARKAAMTPAAEAACLLETPSIAFAFWHAVDGAPKQLPHAVLEGLASCVRNSGLTVVLLSYQCDDVIAGGVPPGVHVRDASKLLAWPVFTALLSRRRVQHLSDYVRVLALVHGVDGARTMGGGGWLIDGDTIWLRRAPPLSVACPPGLGHWFACQQACRALRGHDKRGIESYALLIDE